jgi:ferredoxin--NADP+ reductase
VRLCCHWHWPAPFASIVKDPDVYERFETIVLVHGCRQVSS